MENKNLQRQYMSRLNQLFRTVNWKELDISCNSKDNRYAKEILKTMHDIFLEVYGTDYLERDYEFVDLPAVVQGRSTGHIGLGVVTLCVADSGEHYGTFFLTPMGIIDGCEAEMSQKARKYLRDTYIPYNYWYTVEMECDIHVEFDNLPKEVANLLNCSQLDQPEMRME